MRGRPRLLEENEMLDKAVHLFWKHGYEATSLDDLLKCMNLNKGSLYYAFGSKRELFAKALDFFGRKSREDLNNTLSSASTPVEGIRTFFLNLASSDETIHKKGCLMGNTITELSGIDNELKNKAVSHLKDLEATFLKIIDNSKVSGELKTNEDSTVIARYLVTLWNGINITRRMYPTTEDLVPVIKMQLSILK